MKQIVFFDTEINPKTNEILDIGAIDTDGRQLHTKAPHAFSEFLTGYTYVGGHNILACDLKYMKCYIEKETESGEQVKYIDTLYLSPLLFTIIGIITPCFFMDAASSLSASSSNAFLG